MLNPCATADPFNGEGALTGYLSNDQGLKARPIHSPGRKGRVAALGNAHLEAWVRVPPP
jgi:hypothetical protein